MLSPAVVDADEMLVPDRLSMVEAVSLPVTRALPDPEYGLVTAVDGRANMVDESIDVAEEPPMSIDEKLLRIEDMLLAKLPPLTAEELADPPEDPTFEDVGSGVSVGSLEPLEVKDGSLLATIGELIDPDSETVSTIEEEPLVAAALPEAIELSTLVPEALLSTVADCPLAVTGTRSEADKDGTPIV